MPDHTTSLQPWIGRRFSFHPPVRNVRHNEWIFRRANWSECIIANGSSGLEFTIPQSFIRAILHVDDPVIVVALRRELKCAAGRLVPFQRTVIDLPRAPSTPGYASPHSGPAPPVIGIRIEPNWQSRFAKRTSWVLLVASIAVTILLGVTTR